MLSFGGVKLLWTVLTAAVFIGLVVSTSAQACDPNCLLPNCSCPRFQYGSIPSDQIPQMVYFGFDDAVTVAVASFYNQIFTPQRLNPNNCRMKMTLFVSDEYSDYNLVRGYHEIGHEIAVHSVTHTNVVTANDLYYEAGQQRLNIANYANVPLNEIVGWRSPFLKPAGDDQPVVLNDIGFEYDATYTYLVSSLSQPKPWPFTMHDGWPYNCGVPECPTNSSVPGFWAVPVNSVVDHLGLYPCSFVDGCHVRPGNQENAYTFLMDNFNAYYNGDRAPFGLHMHAAWFYFPGHLEGMIQFIETLQTMNDVYVVTIKQMIDWMKNPTPLSNIHTLDSWQCV